MHFSTYSSADFFIFLPFFAFICGLYLITQWSKLRERNRIHLGVGIVSWLLLIVYVSRQYIETNGWDAGLFAVDGILFLLGLMLVLMYAVYENKMRRRI